MTDTWIATKICKSLCVDGEIHSITADNNGRFYFTSGREKIYQVHKDGTVESEPQILITIKGAYLLGIVWNGSNNKLYICDGSHRVWEYSIGTGNLSTLAGNEKLGNGNIKDDKITYPTGIALDKDGDLYVTSLHVRKINLSDRTVITIAGFGEMPGHADGEANQAKFDNPCGLVVSGDGTIYVADKWNNCIRKIKDGIVSTIAGIPGEADGYKDGPLSQAEFRYPSKILLDSDGNLLIDERFSHYTRKLSLKDQLVSTLDQNELCKMVDKIFIKDSKHFIVGGARNSLMKLERPWNWERLLWIGNKKDEASYCHLASLPKDIVREIASYVRPPINAYRVTFSEKFISCKQWTDALQQ